jgi:Dolichyl-phosphate-mannose-protein mannosyltransferase
MDTNKETEATVAVASAGLRNRELKVLWIAVLCILILKLIFVTLAVSHLKDEINPLYGIGHADNYYSLAKNVSHGRGLRFDPDTSLTLMREPGYPYFLAVFVHEFEDYNRAAIIANIVLTALTAFLMFNLTRKLTTLAWVAVVGPILYMIHPGVVLAELRSGVEVLYIFLLLIFLSVLRMALSSESTRCCFPARSCCTASYSEAAGRRCAVPSCKRCWSWHAHSSC